MPFQVTKDPVERACCVPICNNQKFNLTHKFPGNEQKCDEWLLTLDISKLYTVPKQKLLRSYFICTRHFLDEDYKFPTSRYLNTTAVPSINIKDLSQLDLVSSRWKSDNHKAKRKKICQNMKEKDLLLNENVEHIEINLTTENENIVEPNEIYIEIDSDIDTEPNSNPISIQDLKMNSSKSDNFSVENKKSKFDIEVECRKNYKDLPIYRDDIENQFIALDQPEIIETKNDISILSITHPNYDETIVVNLFWLRDHCKCSLCYNHETYQRKTNILDIPLDVSLIETELNNGKLFAKWEDGHESEYDLDFLFKNQYKQQILMNFNEYFPWDKHKINSDENKFVEVDFGRFLISDKLAETVVESIVKFGIAFIKNVPPTTDMTELTIKRLFPIQKTLFGEMWTFTSNKDRADTAYTNEHLGPHNDNTYFCDAAGLQVFHCIKFDGTGGQSIFVDGFNAAEELQIEDPESLEILSKVNVSAEYIDKDQHHKYSAPIIQFDSNTAQLKQIRFNLYDRSDFNGVESNKIKSFYKSLKKFAEIINAEKNIFKYELKPGTVAIFDNWRILHGREEFTGVRVMTGCYVSRTDFMSKARAFGLVK